jgi:thermitase
VRKVSKLNEKNIRDFTANGCELIKKSHGIATLKCPESAAKGAGLTKNIKAFAFDSDIKYSTGDTNINANLSDLSTDQQIGANKVWNKGISGLGTTISEIDTGVDCNHRELVGTCKKGWNFIANNDNTFDDNGHGTHVGGIIASHGLYDPKSRGVASGANIVPLKIFDAYGVGTFDDATRAIYWSVNGADGVYGTYDDPHVDVISMSISSGPPYTYRYSDCNNVIPELKTAIDYARSKGIIVVAAAGNWGESGIGIPACIQGVLAVRAVDSSSAWARFSGVGDEQGVAAPGIGIYSTWPSDGYNTLSGTSLATPMVSGTIALMKQANRRASADEITRALLNTAKDLGQDGCDAYYGCGLVNAQKAVNEIKEIKHR